MLSPTTENSRIQGLFKALSNFPVIFKADLISRTFQESPLNSSNFQGCASLRQATGVQNFRTFTKATFDNGVNNNDNNKNIYYIVYCTQQSR